MDTVTDRRDAIKPVAVLWVVSIVLLLLAAICAGFILWQVIRYGVEVPFWDEWGFLSDYQRYDAGQIPLSALLMAHESGHLHGLGQFVAAIGIQEAGWLLLWRLMGMSFRSIMVWNWLLAVAFIILMALVARQALPRPSLIPWAILNASSFFVFNPGAYQLWMWSIPPAYLIGPLLFLAAAFCAQLKLPVNAIVTIAAAAAMVASLTFGGGVLLWALLPVVIVTCVSWRELLRHQVAVAVYVSMCLLTAVLHLYNLHTYYDHAPPFERPVTWIELAGFFLAYTGNLVFGLPIAGLISWARAMGAALLIFLTLSVAAAVRSCRGKPEWNAIIIWLCLAVYQLFTGGLVTLARHNFGPAYPVEASRYVLSTSFLPVVAVAIAMVAAHAFRSRLPSGRLWYSGLLISLAAVVTVCLIIRVGQVPSDLAAFRSSYRQQVRGKVALAAANLLRMREYRGIYPNIDPEGFRRIGRFVTQRAGFPAMWDDAFIRKLATIAASPAEMPGYLDGVVPHDGKLSLSGWAYLKSRQAPADAVILLAIPPSSPARLLVVAFPDRARLDVAHAVGNARAGETGFVVEVPGPLPETGTIIRCFGYDVKSGEVHPLLGDKRL